MSSSVVKSCDHSSPNIDVIYPRWDKADTAAYYGETGVNLAPVLQDLDRLLNYDKCNIDKTLACDIISELYERIVFVLRNSERQFVPKHRKNYYKFWWNEELAVLKQASVESDRAWKAIGKPRSGAIFNKRQQCRLLYRKRLKECQMEPSVSYSNNLHDALLCKNNTLFWKCWRSKFETSNRCVEVDQCIDSDVIADKFASHFCNAYKANDANTAELLHKQYAAMRSGYCGFPVTDDHRH